MATLAPASANPSAKIDPIYQTMESHLLSDLSLEGETLLFGLNFKHTEVDKKGIINRFRKNKHTLDLDLSCLLFNKHLEVIDTIWFKNLRDDSAAVRHHGDSLNGKDRGDEAELNRKVDVETIELRLARLPKTVTHIALLLSSYQDYPLKLVTRGDVRIGDDEGNYAYSRSLDTLDPDITALCIALLSRELGEWRLTINNLVLRSSDINEMTEQVQQEMSRFYTSRL